MTTVGARVRSLAAWGIAVALLLALGSDAESAQRATRRGGPAPRRPAARQPAPRLLSLTVEPGNVILYGPKMRQQLIVTGRYSDGLLRDLTRRARFRSLAPRVASVRRGGLVFPVADGRAPITASVDGKQARTVVTVRNTRAPFHWNFNIHVEPVFSKAGCSMGACHGAAQGKNGFRLTLRGYDPELDYERLRLEASGRRINRADPGNSLILLKATLTVPHQGGPRFKVGSLEYRVLSEWIAAGMPGPSDSDPRLLRLEVYPKHRVLTPGAQQQLVVLAHFSDGHVEDVTHWARYSSNEEAVATVDDSTGLVTVAGAGETAIAVFYLDKVAISTVSVPYPNRIDPAIYARLPAHNYIDRLIYKKLRDLRLLPSDLATDEEFIRRVYLDIAGILPTPDEVRAFLADSDPNKRAKLVDALLERPEYVDFWTYKLSDILRISRETLEEKGMWAFHFWLREQIRLNRGWHQIARDVLTAAGPTFETGPANYYRIERNPDTLAETTAQAFLGVRIQCAKCHNHPFERWTQNNYYEFANFFARVGRKQGDTSGRDMIIYPTTSGDINHPKLGKPLPPTPFGGEPIPLNAPGDRREALVEWMTAPNNPYFAYAMVNRIWRHYMGRGLVEPVDDLRDTNPPSNGELFDALARDFIAHQFDMKYLMRTIVLSRAYQLSSRPNRTNARDEKMYSRFLVKRLTAEQLLDAICQVTGVPEKFGGLPLGTRASQLPDTKVNSYFLDVFGRPARQITCECERAQEPNMAQALHLINGASVNQKISAKGGLVDRLIEAKKSDSEILDEMYLACYARYPTAAERQAILKEIQAAMTPPAPPPANAGQAAPQQGQPQAQSQGQPQAQPPAFDPAAARRQVLEDVLWSLINGKEFVFNH